MLKNEIDALIQSAMKSGDETRLNTLRMIKSAILVLEKSGETYTEASEMKMLLKMKASIEDSIKQFTDGGRADLAEKEKSGLKILSEFLPKEASEDEIKDYTDQVITCMNTPVSMKDMKFILSEVQKRYPTANGKIVSDVVRSRM